MNGFFESSLVVKLSCSCKKVLHSTCIKDWRDAQEGRKTCPTCMLDYERFTNFLTGKELSDDSLVEANTVVETNNVINDLNTKISELRTRSPVNHALKIRYLKFLLNTMEYDLDAKKKIFEYFTAYIDYYDDPDLFQVLVDTIYVPLGSNKYLLFWNEYLILSLNA